jgi:hypothetical protein
MHKHYGSTQENYIACISSKRLVWVANPICISTVRKPFRLNQTGPRPHGHRTRLVQTAIMCKLHDQYAMVKQFKYEETDIQQLMFVEDSNSSHLFPLQQI